MDILAHGLWTNVMFRGLPPTRQSKKAIWWGILFGVLPDLISFSPIFAVLFFNLLTGKQRFASWPPDETMKVFRYAAKSYNYTHSFVTWTVILLIAWVILRKFPWPILGAFLHIIIDLFTHPNFYRTPFLYPLSHIHNPYAISWADPVFMIINYTAIALVYIFVIPYWKRKFAKSNFNPPVAD
jgi:hypothetical protein